MRGGRPYIKPHRRGAREAAWPSCSCPDAAGDGEELQQTQPSGKGRARRTAKASVSAYHRPEVTHAT